MRLLILILTVPLAACQTTGVPLDATFPAVPPEIVACAQRANSAIPVKDLSAAEVEASWKQDRYTSVALRQCLQRLIIRDRQLAKR
jgi:hypothetical protein